MPRSSISNVIWFELIALTANRLKEALSVNVVVCLYILVTSTVTVARFGMPTVVADGFITH
jgi:hypothetical protein